MMLTTLPPRSGAAAWEQSRLMARIGSATVIHCLLRKEYIIARDARQDDNETGFFENECKRRGAQHIHDWVFDNRVTHCSNSPSPLASPEDTLVSFHALARFALRALACSC
jgi:hypothetical protein